VFGHLALRSHTDLAPDLDVSSSISCIASEPSIEDGQGHGTQVAGIAAASQGNGMVGIASEASIVAVKVFDSTGYGSGTEVICGLDHVAGLFATDGIPTVVNRDDWTQPVSGIAATSYRDESFIKGQSGKFVYQVCNADESVCSDWVTVDL